MTSGRHAAGDSPVAQDVGRRRVKRSNQTNVKNRVNVIAIPLTSLSTRVLSASLVMEIRQSGLDLSLELSGKSAHNRIYLIAGMSEMNVGSVRC